MKPSPLPIAAIICVSLLAVACGGTSDNSTYSACAVQSRDETKGAEVGIGSSTLGGSSVAQSFRLSSNLNLRSLQIQLLRKGSPNGTLTLTIEADSGGTPSGNPLATGKVAVETSTGTQTGNISETRATLTTFNLASAVTLSANQTYWIRVEASYGHSDSHLILWAANDTNAYADGKAVYETAPKQWSSADIGSNRDLLFQLGCN